MNLWVSVSFQTAHALQGCLIRSCEKWLKSHNMDGESQRIRWEERWHWHMHTELHTDTTEILTTLTLCLLSVWVATSPSGRVHFYVWVSEPLTSQSLGLLQCGGQTLTRKHTHTPRRHQSMRGGEESTYTDRDKEPQPPPQSTIRQSFLPLYMMNSFISTD